MAATAEAIGAVIERVRETVHDFNRGKTNVGRLYVDALFLAAELERLQGEIERLRAERDAEQEGADSLARSIRLLEFDQASSWEIFNELRHTLAAVGCRHGHDHAATPPMFFREWLLCALGKAKERQP